MKVRPWVVIAITLIFAIWLVVYYQLNQRASSAEGPSHIHVSPAGELYLLVGRHLYRFAADGRFKADYDLARVGITRMQGDFGIFANGEVLLRIGRDQPGVLEKIAIFLRMRNRSSSLPVDHRNGLYRCHLETAKCRRFGESIDYNRVFHLFIRPAVEDVFIADTSRFVIRHHDRQGNLVGVRIRGLTFPNQLLVDDGKLYIANTNRHVIHVCRIDGDTFCKPVRDIDVVPPEARQRGERWPASMLHVDRNWWVINMKAGMNNGGIYVFDHQWRFRYRLPLPDDADPFALVAWRGRVLVTDNHNFRIRRFRTNGSPDGDFAPEKLRPVFAALATQRAHYRMLANASIGIMAVLLVIVFGVAVMRERRLMAELGTAYHGASSEVEGELSSSNVLEEIPEGQTVWLLPTRKIRRLLGLAMVYALVLPALAAVIAMMLDWRREVVFLVVMLLSIMLPLAVLFWWTLRQRIGTDGRLLYVEDFRGRRASGSGNEIWYTDNHILIGDVGVSLGNRMNPLFRKERFEAYVRPLLRDAQCVSTLQMSLRLLKQRNPVTLMSVALILIGLAGIVVFEVWIK